MLDAAPSAGWRRNERTQRGLKLAFGIDQEVCGGDDLFSSLESFQDDEIVSDAGT